MLETMLILTCYNVQEVDDIMYLLMDLEMDGTIQNLEVTGEITTGKDITFRVLDIIAMDMRNSEKVIDLLTDINAFYEDVILNIYRFVKCDRCNYWCVKTCEGQSAAKRHHCKSAIILVQEDSHTYFQFDRQTKDIKITSKDEKLIHEASIIHSLLMPN